MCVAGDALFAVGVAEDAVGGFSSDAGQLDELVHGVGDFRFVFFDDGFGGGDYVFGFVFVEAGRADVLLELFRVGAGVVVDGFVFFEEVFCDDVYADIGALGRKYDSDEQLEGVFVFKRDPGVRVSFFQYGENLFYALPGFGFNYSGPFLWCFLFGLLCCFSGCLLCHLVPLRLLEV